MDYAASKFILKRDARVTLYAYYWSDLVEGRRLQLTNDDGSNTFVAIHLHENRLYILEGTVSPSSHRRRCFSSRWDSSTRRRRVQVRNHLRQRIPTTSPHEVTTPACSVLPRKEELRRRTWSVG